MKDKSLKSEKGMTTIEIIIIILLIGSFLIAFYNIMHDSF